MKKNTKNTPITRASIKGVIRCNRKYSGKS